MPTVMVNDLSMYYEIEGDGPPLLLITGLGSNVTDYRAIVRAIAAFRKVIIFDNRGAGRSGMPDIPYSITMMADDANGLMTTLGIERADVLGISMGGRIALMLALRHPDRVSHLILASTAARRPHLPRFWKFSHLTTWIPWLRGPYRQPMYAYQRQVLASQDFDVSDRLAEITAPTLIMHGQRDRLISYELAEELHAKIPGSRMITFQGGHLFMFLKERLSFVQALKAFVEDDRGVEPSR